MQILPATYTLPWILLAIAIIAMATIAIIIWPKLIRIRRRNAADNAAATHILDSNTSYPPVSVIVYAQSCGENLRTLLPQILNQDYPAPTEVIVVNDQSSDNTETIVTELEMQHSNLYMTFAPPKSRNLSRRKLAITLGIKAARYETLIHTHGNCRIPSPLWLRMMIRHIADGHQIVIGYATPAGPDATPDTDRRLRRRTYDFLWDTIRYLSAAITHHPLRATGYNLAYTRTLFFNHKGFSRTLNLQYGDDDLFLNEIATPANTAVELSDEARVIAAEASPARLHDIYRLRRDFTARQLPRHTYLTMALTSILWWIWPPCAIAAALLPILDPAATAAASISATPIATLFTSLTPPTLLPAAILLLATLTFLITHIILWLRTSRALSLPPSPLCTPILALLRPFRTLRHRLRARSSRHIHTTFPA